MGLDRRAFLLGAAALGAPGVALAQTATQSDFQAWVAGAEAAALLAGISQATTRSARQGLVFQTGMLRPAGTQAESGRVGRYVQRLVTGEAPVARRKLAEFPAIAAIERRYGVPGSVLVAFWGRESGYGRDFGSLDVFSTLATRGTGRLGSSTDWTAEYVAALTIVERGIRSRPMLTGSSAGAMGHTQLMPTSYLAYGDDFDGDGRANIWSASPIDALASAARHIQEAPVSGPPIPPEGHAWKRGGGWIEPVRLPQRLDFNRVEVEVTRITPAEWEAAGVRKIAPGPWRARDAASQAHLALPAGIGGPAFLLFPNFDVFEAYNPSRTYALAVGLLARAIEGRPGVTWPEETPITLEDRQAAQSGLAALGFYAGRIDGDLGRGSRAAIRRWQMQRGQPADGYLTPQIVASLRG